MSVCMTDHLRIHTCLFVLTSSQVQTGTSPGLNSLNSVKGPGLTGGPGRAPRGAREGAKGEVHVDLDIGFAEKERSI